MKNQLTLWGLNSDPNDIVYTPEIIAKDIIYWLSPNGVCLDPCKGGGAFYKYLPMGRAWCELQEGKDFFDFKCKVDWIIGNPPFKTFESFLQHSFELAQNVCYLVPTNKIFQRKK